MTTMQTSFAKDLDELTLRCEWCESSVRACDTINAPVSRWWSKEHGIDIYQTEGATRVRINTVQCFECAMVDRCEGCDSINAVSEMDDGLCKDCQGGN
jgi:hypothetical protein